MLINKYNIRFKNILFCVKMIKIIIKSIILKWYIFLKDIVNVLKNIMIEYIGLIINIFYVYRIIIGVVIINLRK